MMDRKSSKVPHVHVKNHLRVTLWAPEDLKDEAYVQVLKQIREHRDYDKSMKGWNFLAILASCYAPSSDLFYPLMNKLAEDVRNNTDQNIVKHANYVIVRLFRSFEQKRKQIPSDMEIIHIETMKQMMIPIFFFSETSTIVPAESYTTFRELKTTVMRKLQLNISRIPYYALYEICEKQNFTEERFLEDIDKIVDIQAMWSREVEMFQKNNQTIDFKVYLKIQLYYPYNENDVDTITMHYVQTGYDVNIGKFSLTESDAITLGAIKCMVDFPDMSHEEINVQLEKKIERFVPINKLKDDRVGWTTKIMEFYATQKRLTKHEAKLTYLEHLKENSMWESQQFAGTFNSELSVKDDVKITKNVILGIKPTGLNVCDEDRNELVSLSYSKIISWGVNNSTFVVVLPKRNNSDDEYPKYYFESHQTKMIQLLIEAYTNLIVGKNIMETMNNAYNSVKSFESMPGMKLGKGETARSRTATQYSKNR